MSETVIEGGLARRLIVVANGSHGKAWVKRLGESGYDAVLSWDAPDVRRSDASQGEDRPGRAFPAAGATQRSAMEHEGKDDSPKEHAKRDLAKRIAQDIGAALRGASAESFVLVAPSPVASAVLSHIPADQRAALAGEDHHDLTGLPTDVLFRRLDALRQAG